MTHNKISKISMTKASNALFAALAAIFCFFVASASAQTPECSPGPCEVYIDNGAARAGDMVVFPLRIRGCGGTLNPGDIVNFTLSYNASLLNPLSAPPGVVVDGLRTIPYAAVVASVENGSALLSPFRARAMLGTAPFTWLILSDLRRGNATLGKGNNGYFALRGLSYADGTRLINNVTTAIVNVSVQPLIARSEQALTVQFDIDRNMDVAISISAEFGEVVSVLGSARYLQSGNPQRVTVDISTLRTGRYYLYISSLLQSVALRFEVIR